MGKLQSCIAACDSVLEGEANNRKALYRRGQARLQAGSLSGAIDDLQRALALSPPGYFCSVLILI